MLHAVRGYFRFAHIEAHRAELAVYARLPGSPPTRPAPKDSTGSGSSAPPQIAQSSTVHHGALAFLLGTNALRAYEAASVQIEGDAETQRGHRVLHLVGKCSKPATMPVTVPALRSSMPAAASGPMGHDPAATSVHPIDGRDVYRMALRKAKVAGIPRRISPTRMGTPPSPARSTPGSRYETRRSSPVKPIPAPPGTTTGPEATSTAAASTSSLLTRRY